MNLERFEYTPPTQPVEDDPVIFTLKPLDQRGFMNMTAVLSSGEENTDKAAEICSRYIVKWRGGGQEPCEAKDQVRQRLRDAINGEPNVFWSAWLAQIANELMTRAIPKEGDAKKF